MGNSCAVCSKGTEVRAQVDAAIVQGLSFREISKQFENHGIGYQSVWRHAQLHLSDDLRDAVADAQKLKVGAFAVRLQEIADRTREASDAAMESGHPRDVARTIDSEIRALNVLMQRMGIDDQDTVHSLREGYSLAVAMIRIIRQHPEIGLAPLLIQELRDLKEDPLADNIEQHTKELTQ